MLDLQRRRLADPLCEFAWELFGEAERGFSQGENCFSLVVEKETGFRNCLIGIPKAHAAAPVTLNTGQRQTGCKTRQTSRPQESSVCSSAPFEI
jgi:hypothetical protein